MLCKVCAGGMREGSVCWGVLGGCAHWYMFCVGCRVSIGGGSTWGRELKLGSVDGALLIVYIGISAHPAAELTSSAREPHHQGQGQGQVASWSSSRTVHTPSR